MIGANGRKSFGNKHVRPNFSYILDLNEENRDKKVSTRFSALSLTYVRGCLKAYGLISLYFIFLRFGNDGLLQNVFSFELAYEDFLKSVGRLDSVKSAAVADNVLGAINDPGIFDEKTDSTTLPSSPLTSDETSEDRVGL